jgi:predicted MPP superfamily phosphohydrolase
MCWEHQPCAHRQQRENCQKIYWAKWPGRRNQKSASAMSRRQLKVLVISDVHLGFLGAKAKELNKYLKSVQPEILIINGDFIDIWQFRKYYFPNSHAKVLQRVLKMAVDGTKVYYMTGNHDELLRNTADFILAILMWKTNWF